MEDQSHLTGGLGCRNPQGSRPGDLNPKLTSAAMEFFQMVSCNDEGEHGYPSPGNCEDISNVYVNGDKESWTDIQDALMSGKTLNEEGSPHVKLERSRCQEFLRYPFYAVMVSLGMEQMTLKSVKTLHMWQFLAAPHLRVGSNANGREKRCFLSHRTWLVCFMTWMWKGIYC